MGCLGLLTAEAGADSSVAAPMVKYESAFTDYQPFREPQIKSWKEVNKEVADNPSMGHNMGAMKMDAPGGAKTREAAAGHDMSTMKTMPGKTMPKTMPGMDKQAADAPKSKGGAAGHDMAAMKAAKGNETMAMAHPEAKSGQSPRAAGAGITAFGVVQGIDKNSGKIKLTHDPVAALGWPKMTMFFRLKDSALAEQLNEGDRIEFSLEKSASGFVISALHKVPARNEPR